MQSNENIRNEKCVEEKRIKIGSLGCMHHVISIAVHEKQKEKRQKKTRNNTHASLRFCALGSSYALACVCFFSVLVFIYIYFFVVENEA